MKHLYFTSPVAVKALALLVMLARGRDHGHRGPFLVPSDVTLYVLSCLPKAWRCEHCCGGSRREPWVCALWLPSGGGGWLLYLGCPTHMSGGTALKYDSHPEHTPPLCCIDEDVMFDHDRVKKYVAATYKTVAKAVRRPRVSTEAAALLSGVSGFVVKADDDDDDDEVEYVETSVVCVPPIADAVFGICLSEIDAESARGLRGVDVHVCDAYNYQNNDDNSYGCFTYPDGVKSICVLSKTPELNVRAADVAAWTTVGTSTTTLTIRSPAVFFVEPCVLPSTSLVVRGLRVTESFARTVRSAQQHLQRLVIDCVDGYECQHRRAPTRAEYRHLCNGLRGHKSLRSVSLMVCHSEEGGEAGEVEMLVKCFASMPMLTELEVHVQPVVLLQQNVTVANIDVSPLVFKPQLRSLSFTVDGTMMLMLGVMDENDKNDVSDLVALTLSVAASAAVSHNNHLLPNLESLTLICSDSSVDGMEEQPIIDLSNFPKLREFTFCSRGVEKSFSFVFQSNTLTKLTLATEGPLIYDPEMIRLPNLQSLRTDSATDLIFWTDFFRGNSASRLVECGIRRADDVAPSTSGPKERQHLVFPASLQIAHVSSFENLIRVGSYARRVSLRRPHDNSSLCWCDDDDDDD
eukprot:PhM_4_TR17378/c1_g1_i1/m.73035